MLWILYCVQHWRSQSQRAFCVVAFKTAALRTAEAQFRLGSAQMRLLLRALLLAAAGESMGRCNGPLLVGVAIEFRLA